MTPDILHIIKKDNKELAPWVNGNISTMYGFLSRDTSKEIDADKIMKLMVGCLSIVVDDLHLQNKYKEYEPKNYTEKDLTDMVFKAMAQAKTTLKTEDIDKYVQDFRSVLWGHAQYHRDDYLKLYSDMTLKKENSSHFSMLTECMTIVTMEGMLKNLENKRKTLKDVMPVFLSDKDGKHSTTRAYRMLEEQVAVEHGCLSIGDGEVGGSDASKAWPGSHKNVFFWVELKSGYAVGFNENPSRGYSFPVIKMKEKKC